ncbi:sodium:solute symporter family protein [Deltaproteobacteria bacterium OttesenSCG-928-M10]|nr:sodium:solute symporter family protein [Deltaproteobacteria bacterium OttesenSCG-928-M10]
MPDYPVSFLYVLPIIVAMIVAVGVVEYYNRRVKTVESFYVADRGANTLLLTGAYVASWASCTGMVGMSGSAYRFGIAWNMWTWGFWGVVLFTFAIAIPLRKMCTMGDVLAPSRYASGAAAKQLLTVSDFFELRFPSKFVRGLTAVMQICGMTFYAVGQLIAICLALTCIGLSYQAGLVIMTILIMYTTIRGGTPGILVNDCINMFTFVFAVIVMVPYALHAVGGIDNMIAVSEAAQPGIWGNMGVGKSLVAIVAYNLVWNSMTAGSPHLVQRAYTAKSLRTFMKAQVIGVTIVIMWCWALYTGTQTGLIFFPGIVSNESDKILMMVSQHTMPVFLAGVVIASIFAVGFSTVNAQISNLAFAWTRDIHESFLVKDKSTWTEARMLKVTKVAIAIISLIVAFFTWTRPGFIYEITAWGIAFYGSTFVPMFIFGLYWKRCTTQGVMAGAIISSLTFITLGILGMFKMSPVPADAHPFIVSLPVSVIIMVVVSLLTKQSPAEEEVAGNMHKVLKMKNDEPTTTSDYMAPIIVIIICVVFGVIWSSIF